MCMFITPDLSSGIFWGNGSGRTGQIDQNTQEHRTGYRVCFWENGNGRSRFFRCGRHEQRSQFGMPEENCRFCNVISKWIAIDSLSWKSFQQHFRFNYFWQNNSISFRCSVCKHDILNFVTHAMPFLSALQ